MQLSVFTMMTIYLKRSNAKAHYRMTRFRHCEVRNLYAPFYDICDQQSGVLAIM